MDLSKPGIPLNEPQTETGRADHDRAWRKGDDSPVDHAQSRDDCEGCAFVARVEREARGIPLIDVELRDLIGEVLAYTVREESRGVYECIVCSADVSQAPFTHDEDCYAELLRKRLAAP